MSQENYFSNRMGRMSNDELKNYLDNKDDFREDAVIAAILELEKRGFSNEKTEELKLELNAIATVSDQEENIDEPFDSSSFSGTPTLYSTKFIFIFGALFSVFGGGILMALNFLELKNKKGARMAVVASLGYTIFLIYLFEFLGVANAIVSLFTSVLGIYLLYQFLWKKEFPIDFEYKEKDVWKPVIIGIILMLPLAYILVKSGNF